MESYNETVINVDGEIKIRDYLKNRLGLSASLIGKVKYGNVLVNGEEVHMRKMIKNGDLIKILLPEEDSENIEPMDIDLDVIYDDDYMMAVNKPKNMPVHPSKGNHLPTLANGVRAYIGKPFVFRAINRLDRDTSGIVLIAKDRLSAVKLYRAMKEKLFKKTYIALVKGCMETEHGFIDVPIDRECEGSIKRIVREDGKPCLTEYEVIKRTSDGNSVLRVIPHTGRTHQIRVHMSHINHPLIGDFLYGDRIDGKTYLLHCETLAFPHPITDEIISLTAPSSDASDLL